REVVPATPRTRIIRADLDGHEFRFHAGQVVRVGLADGTVRRPYSIACSPGQAERSQALELLVQIDDQASADPHLERAVPGTLLHIEGPFGSFGVPHPLPERRLLLIAGGTGIAPLRSILWDTLERDPGVDIALIYSARNPQEFAYGDELRALAAEGRIRLVLTVTREGDTSWSGLRGRIDASMVAAMLTTPETRCVICGPVPLVAHTRTLLTKAGVAGERILVETYAD